LQRLKLDKLPWKFEPTSDEALHPRQQAQIVLDGKTVGRIVSLPKQAMEELFGLPDAQL